MNNVRLVQLTGEKKSNMMARKLMQTDKKTELRFNPCSSKSCATYVGTKTIQDLNIYSQVAVESQQHSAKKWDVMVTKPKLAEEGTKFQPNYDYGKISAPHFGCNARRKLNLLTEDEKEERRLRRVLANRESARQAILRRQAHHQELARRAAELERENNNLKKEKEVAMKKYKSLRSTNESLKAQLKLKKVMVNAEVAESQEGLKFNDARVPTPTSPQLYISNQPSSLPYVLPFVIPGTPYLPPYTWLFPLSYQATGAQSLDFASQHYITKESGTSSFRKTVADVKDDQRFPLKIVRGEASASTKNIGPSVVVHSGKASGKRLAHQMSSKGNEETVIGSSVRQKDAIKRSTDFITSAAATSSSTDGSLLRRRTDAFAAAEARKRRMEVVRSKNFNYSRQSHVKISSV